MPIKDPEKKRAADIAYRENNRDKLRAKAKKRYQDRREFYLEWARKHYLQIRHQKREYNKRYYAENIMQLREYKANRRKKRAEQWVT